MQLDTRAILLTFWLTMLVGSLTTAATLAQNDVFPRTLGSSGAIIGGIWLAAIMAGALVMLFGWHTGHRSASASVTSGYVMGAGLRVIFINKPDMLLGWEKAENSFVFLWEALTLQAFPAYDGFLLLLFLGGIILAISTIMILSVFIPKGVDPIADISPPNPLTLWSAATLSCVILWVILLLSNLRDSETYNDLILFNVNWLTLPQTNMIVIAFIGFGVGAAYNSPTRWHAAMTLFVVGMVQVMVMLLSDEMLAIYDPAYGGLDANRVNVPAFSFFWVGTPVIGAMAAFALHNLRDAFDTPASVSMPSREA